MKTETTLTSDPVCFRGRKFRAQKGYFKGTHRFCSPEETFEKLMGAPLACGVTRSADITGLDRIGIPVTLAIRPNGMTLSVSSGKAMTRESAWVSGIMEAYELHHCETYPFSPLHFSYQEMAQQKVVPDLTQFCMKKGAIFHASWPMRWVLGWDLLTQQEIALPLTAVSLNCHIYKDAHFFELNAFDRTSNGLASGNCFLEAICSGIYELIERDAITCHDYAKSVYTPPKVKLNSIPYAEINDLLERLKKSGMGLELFDCTLDTGVYVFEAFLYDNYFSGQGIHKGFGAHLDPSVAMLRAITEAVQGRLCYISGSRDDIFRSDFQLCMKFDTLEATRKIKAIESTVDACTYSNLATHTFEGDIHFLLNKLRDVGIEHVIVFDLNYGIAPFSFVRVVIPGLEGYASGHYQFGKRAQCFSASKIKGERSEVFSFPSMHRPAGGIG